MQLYGAQKNIGILHAIIQVELFHSNMGWTVSSTDIYNEAWGLRKLFGYAHRREADCYKRGQTPTES